MSQPATFHDRASGGGVVLSLAFWLWLGGALLGLVVALVGYYSHSGIRGTLGAELVSFGAFMLVLADFVVAASPRGVLRTAFLVLSVLAVVLGALAAWFLERPLYVLGMAVVFVAFFLLPSPIEQGEPRMTGKHGLLAGGSIALATALAFAATAQPGTASSGATAQSNGDAAPEPSGQPKAPGQWYTFNGNLEAQKFSPATQITPENVDNLQVAWQVHTGDMSDGSGKVPATDWMTTPLFANNTVYVATPFYNVFAIDPGSGKIKWEYTSNSGRLGLPQGELKNSRSVLLGFRRLARPRRTIPRPRRPLARRPSKACARKSDRRAPSAARARTPVCSRVQANYPPGPDCLKRVYVSTEDAKIHSINADTGQPCTDFGENGVLDLDQWNPLPEKQPMTSLQAPTVYKDELLIGWSGNDWAYQTAIPGSVFAVDARTGKLKWTFEVIPPEDRTTTGTANVWSSMSVDRSAASSISRSARRARTTTAATGARRFPSQPR